MQNLTILPFALSNTLKALGILQSTAIILALLWAILNLIIGILFYKILYMAKKQKPFLKTWSIYKILLRLHFIMLGSMFILALFMGIRNGVLRPVALVILISLVFFSWRIIFEIKIQIQKKILLLGMNSV